MEIRFNLLFLLPLLLILQSSPISAESADVEVRINEEEQLGSFVVNLRQYPSLFLEVSKEDQPKLTFNILDKDNYPAAYFAMDSAMGRVTVGRRVDREEVCEGSVTCALDFNVAIEGTQGLTFTNISSVRVHIDDINDNSPVFPSDLASLKISEGAKVGTVLKLGGPKDKDSLPNNTIQRYDTTLTHPVFSISATRNPDGTSFLNLRLEQVLDRETTAEYDFNIIAYDGGDPPRSDFLRVVINVTDENDNVPEFQPETYDITVAEDAEIGSEVVRVRAVDNDAGVFGKVSYRFSSAMQDSITQLFAINSTSGLITLKSKIVHTAGNSPYSLVVEAFDGGDPPSVNQTVVTVRVLNTGNNAPVVRIVTVSEGDTTEISIPESAKVNAFVAFVNVEDSDEGPNGRVSCSMQTNEAQFRLVNLPNKGYKVLLGLPVDRETVDTYEVAILCRDGGSPPLTTVTPFTVIITDINDNNPMFFPVTYTSSIAENNADGQYIVQVSATDNDSGNNGHITYGWVESEASQYLTIQPQSGIVTARRVLDRETTPVLKFTLMAVDGGDEPRTGTSSLTVTVRDMNDNSPQLRGVPYHFQVSEGAPLGHLVATMAADDVDEGQNGQVEFFFAGSVNGDVPFTVHSNGSIEVTDVLDRETTTSHVFTVLARDKGAIPKSNSTQVTITITDINDNAPSILFPTNVNHSVVITTRPENGITLGRIIAYDDDEGNASSLVYTIFSGNIDQVFDIDESKGKLFLSKLDKLKNPFTYHVVLRVYDQGLPPLYAETSLQIEVNFPNITNPVAVLPSAKTDDNDKKPRTSYVIIVGVIGGATLVLSGIIIGAIFFVLRSERQRKSGDSLTSYKNHYVPAPMKVDVPPEKLEDGRGYRSADRRSSQDDLSSSGLILSPKSLQQKGEAQKKVSFSLDEPDAEVHFEQLGKPREVASAPFPHHSHQDGDAALAWKRLVSPDDINSDTSGDSGTCDSGRGASDDDIHVDGSIDKLSQGNYHHHNQQAGPALTNTNRTPAPANIYAPPSSFSSFRGSNTAGGSFRQAPPSRSGPAAAGRPNFLHTGSYHEGRRDNYRPSGGGKILPNRPALHRPYPHVTPSHHQAPLVSLHPEPLPPPRANMGQGGEKQGCGGERWPAPPKAGLPYHRQGSVLSVEDDASTTTSGSYTLSPENDMRLEGHVSPDVIV